MAVPAARSRTRRRTALGRLAARRGPYVRSGAADPHTPAGYTLISGSTAGTDDGTHPSVVHHRSDRAFTAPDATTLSEAESLGS
ncbi:hypothetical protein [Actinacidiphila sp. bgisy144]|uniref:hypothetical protein n=1 Tax=Actinacidiphila sp. bgisy144 TaxID=3413791 RepID=UPI003EB6DC9D